jgi:aminomethyltransferase
MSLDAEMQAVRLDVALSEPAHVVCLRVTGDDAFDTLDALCPADLHARDGQMLHTLLLDDQGRPVADLYLCPDDEDFILLTEGLTMAELLGYIERHLPAGLAPGLERLDESHRLLSLHGPWAWELMSELVGPGVVGLPYLSFYHEAHWTCFRAGKTGEFGYDLLVERDHAAALEAKLLELGRPLGLGRIGQDTLDQCALENWFFNIRREGRAGVTPLELQLQWRVSRQKDYPGARALQERRAAGVAQRLTCVVSAAEVALGDVVRLDEAPVGTVVNAGFSSVRGDWVALALLDRPVAHSGLRGLTVARDRSPELRTVSPPVLNNRSLFVNPQKHRYRTRDTLEFPSLVRALP